MSPASQGNLEVERYIGSCLISSSVRSSNTNNSVNHPKGPKKGGVTCSNNHHYRHNNYNGVPLCECGANARYGSAGRSWTGMPLISMASSGTRRNRKPTSTTSPAGKISNKGGGGGKGGAVDGNEQTRTPLSRLAIHTQGAPLILSGRYNNTNGSNNKGPPVRQYPARKYNNVNNGKESVEKNPVTTSTGNTPSSSDNLSVASDESSGHSENSLPRIIKPRKRRKKDRKPPPTANVPSTDSPKTISSSENKGQESSNIVTLKPYVPLCYDLYKGSKLSSPLCVVDDERESQTSEEDAHDVKLHHEFDDVEEEEDDDNVALIPYPMCQCSYCDPAGLIWDVDQHCYSPFLTPPSPESPFANIPLFSSLPSSESRSFSLFTNNDPSPAEKDTCSGLRRSWSDPSPSRSAPVCSLSQSLEVSTEIVTSHNGHRDIEIKFYSSSPPSAVPVQEKHSENVKFSWTSEHKSLWGTACELGEEVKRLQVEE